MNKNEEEYEDDYDSSINYEKAIRVIAKNILICAQELQDAGYTFKDFDDDEYYM